MNTPPPGYGVALNDDGTWYVARGYREHDGRTIRDGLPHRYATRHAAYRAAWSDYHKRGEQPGTFYPVCPGCHSGALVRITPLIPGPSGWGYRCKDCGHKWSLDNDTNDTNDTKHTTPYISSKCAMPGPYTHEDCVNGPGVHNLGEPDERLCHCSCHDVARQQIADAQSAGLSNQEIRKLWYAARSHNG